MEVREEGRGEGNFIRVRGNTKRGGRGGGGSMGRVLETFPAQFSGFGQVFFALGSFELIVARCALYPG